MTAGFGFSLVVVKVYPTLVLLFCSFLWYRATEVFLSKPSNSHFIDAMQKKKKKRKKNQWLLITKRPADDETALWCERGCLL